MNSGLIGWIHSWYGNCTKCGRKPVLKTLLNQCDLSPWFLSSIDYNNEPKPVHVLGVRRENSGLFKRLDEEYDKSRRSECFVDYMSVKFHLHEWQQYQQRVSKSLRNSYLKFIRNWGVQSNSPSGAVLKSWVESRFGIEPTYHHRSLTTGCQSTRFRYRSEVIRGSAHTSAINQQLDLLFEYCQYELQRQYRNCKWLTLYRGTHDPEEYEILESKGVRSCVKLNNLSSFTSDRERAWEFGSTVWEVEVPLYKVFFYSGLLSDSLLKGEEEYMVIGGNYWVKTLLF